MLFPTPSGLGEAIAYLLAAFVLCALVSYAATSVVRAVLKYMEKRGKVDPDFVDLVLKVCAVVFGASAGYILTRADGEAAIGLFFLAGIAGGAFATKVATQMNLLIKSGVAAVLTWFGRGQ